MKIFMGAMIALFYFSANMLGDDGFPSSYRTSSGLRSDSNEEKKTSDRLPLPSASTDTSRAAEIGIKDDALRPKDKLPYNLKVGPIELRTTPSFRMDFSDNVNLSDTDPQFDIIVQPQIGIEVYTPVARLNKMSFTTTLGYAKHIFHPEADTSTSTTGLLISPDSGFKFDMFIGDFKIDLHDRFSYQHDPINEPMVSDVSSFGRFSNTMGVTVTWDLNNFVSELTYDHSNSISTEKRFNFTDSLSKTLAERTTYHVTETVATGLNSSQKLTTHDQNFQNNGTELIFGPFLDARLTPYLSGNIGAGLQLDLFKSNGTNGDQNDLESFYLNLAIQHRMNPVVTHTLSLGRSNQLGLTSNFVSIYYARHQINWRLIKGLFLSSDISFEYYNESQALFSENFARAGGGLALGYQLTKNINSSLSYRHIEKDSNQAFRNYIQNVIGLDFEYSY